MRILLLVLLPALALAMRPQLHFKRKDIQGTWYMQYYTPGQPFIPPNAMDVTVTFGNEGDGENIGYKFWLPESEKWVEIIGNLSRLNSDIPAAAVAEFADIPPFDLDVIFTDKKQVAILHTMKRDTWFLTRECIINENQRHYVLNLAHLAGLKSTWHPLWIRLVKVSHKPSEKLPAPMSTRELIEASK